MFSEVGKEPVNAASRARGGGRMAGTSARSTTMWLLAAGAALFAIALSILAWRGFDASLTAFMLTPLFGLPYLAVAARRWSAWREHLYFLILLPVFHYLATVAAIEAIAPGLDRSIFVAGLAGGAVGSGLSLLPFVVVSRHPRRGALVLAGIVLLTLVGGAGLWADEWVSRYVAGQYAVVLLLFLPWQILFALFLSLLLDASRPPPPGYACGTAQGKA
jgi:hypothetical protein